MIDDKTTRRLAEAEQRIASLERQLLTRTERPAVANFPRDRWLGVTTRIGSDYPTATDANTFGVKLLSAAYTPIAPGPSTVTQRERGTTVIARTWPSRYLPEGTNVVVDRIRGVPDGGEWWIAGSAGDLVAPADAVYTLSIVSGHVYQDGASTPDLDTAGPVISSGGLWLFPNVYYGVTANSVGDSVTRNVPTNYDDEWLNLLQSTYYLVTIYTQWQLPSLSLSDARSLFRAAGHEHTYTDGGAPMTTGTATPDTRGIDDGGVVKIATYLRETNAVSGFADNWMGSSTLRPYYSTSGDNHLANHAQVIAVHNSVRLNTLRIKIVREDSTPYVQPRLSAIRVHVRQCLTATAGPSA